MPENLIEVRSLVKAYRDKVAVDNINFDVYSGEVFGFLGPNGAGKTTTMKMIVGLLQPTSGTINIAGYDIQTQPMLAKASCGYVPDTPNLYAKLTGRELLRFVSDLYDLNRNQAARRMDELLRTFELTSAADDTFDSYSHGMQQKTSLAVALMHDPRVLVPFSSSYEPVRVGVGQVGFYAMLIVTLSFYVRSRIGQKTWRSLHYVSFLTYLIALLHGIAVGSDASLPWVQQYYWISGGTLLFLLSYRIVVNLSAKCVISSTRTL